MELQIIKCKCGAVIAACTVPECYTEASWMSDVRKYAKKGYSIEIVESTTRPLDGCSCSCKKQKQQKELLLFAE